MICQVIIRSFMYGWSRYAEHDGVNDGAELFTDTDLTFGEDYARALIDEGHQREPFHGYDLAAFVAWCISQRRER